MKPTVLFDYLFFVTCVIIILMSVSSCYNRIEGCLDLQASNYDVNSDDACDNCCVFPSLILNLKHEVNGIKYKQDSLLKNDLGQYYLLGDIKFYVSDFSLSKSDNTQIKVLEDICTLDNGFCIEDDVKIIRGTTPQLKVGTVKSFGDFKGLDFNLGLDTNYINKTYVGIPSSHALAIATRIINAKNQIIDFSFNVSKYEYINDTTYQLINTENYRLSLKGNPNAITKPKLFSTIKGKNINFELTINYGTLVTGINLDSSAIYNSPQIIKNLQNIFK